MVVLQKSPVSWSMVMLRSWSVYWREHGHVTEVVRLMEGEWSRYRDSLMSGEWSCYSLASIKEGAWLCYRGGQLQG